MTTIIDVAKHSGVSKSTVSRVVSGNGYVSEESRQKVLQAMEELAYSPNVLARNLKRGATRNIGFIAQGFIDPLSIFLEAFISIAKSYNYYVTLYFNDGDKAKEIEALNQMKYKQLDAIFIFTRANEWQVIEPYSIYGPIATWHRIDSPRIYSSYMDHYSGYLHSLDYLYQRGYRTIGHILGTSKNLNTKARQKAIRTFEDTHQLTTPKEYFFYDLDTDETVAQRWLALAKRPEAMAFYADASAAHFISELENLGYQIPRDVAVIGFDNSLVSRLMHITTVDYSLKQQAENSFLYLYNKLNDTHLPTKELSVRLVERKTVPLKN